MANLKDYQNFLAVIRKQTGLEALVPDESGFVSVRVQDEYTLSLQFIEATEQILCFIEVITLPKITGREVYRDLLSANLFGRGTGGGCFAFEPETEAVVYNYLFNLDRCAAAPETFVTTIEKILQLCDSWADRIRGDLKGNMTVSADEVRFARSSFEINP